jgi:hypothetical protein
MTPTPEQKAKQLYNDAYMRWSYEPSYDKNYLMAKAIADFVCDEVLGYMGADRGHSYWTEVKAEIQKL